MRHAEYGIEIASYDLNHRSINASLVSRGFIAERQSHHTDHYTSDLMYWSRGNHVVTTWYARETHVVYTCCTRGLHVLYTRYTRGIHVVTTWYTRVVHVVYTWNEMTSSQYHYQYRDVHQHGSFFLGSQKKLEFISMSNNTWQSC